MAGYCDYSMSNNALEAYERGLLPLSRLTASKLPAGWTIAKAKAAAKTGDWRRSEWHHCSSHYNKVDFYDPQDLNELNPEDYIASARQPKTEGEIEITYPLWGGSIRRPRLMGYKTEPATKRGDWAILANGTKKKLTANNVSWHFTLEISKKRK